MAANGDDRVIPSFDRDLVFERLALDERSWVDIARQWVTGADEVYQSLLTGVDWRSSRLFRYDHFVEERRLGAGWRPGDPVAHPLLLDIHRHLRHRYGAPFGGFGMIQYRDGADGQAFHRDTDMRWLDDTRIAILTFGATRPWLLRPKAAKHTDAPGKGATHDLAPASGDLIVMGGRCQADWEHSVPYLPVPYLPVSQIPARPLEPRISIQWRFARRTGQPFRGASYRAPLFYGK